MHTNGMNFNRIWKIYIIYLVMIIALPHGIIGCSKSEEIPEIKLPSTTVLSIQSTWAVVTSTHLRLRGNPSTESIAVATLWKGSVLEVMTRSEKKEIVEGENDYWYQVSFGGLTGWVYGAYLEIFSSKDKAEKASEEIK